MATIAEFTVPGADFPLGRIFDNLPTATVELERVVPTNKGLLPYFWVRDAPPDDIENALTAEPAFDLVTCIDVLDDQSLYRAQWNPAVEGVLTGVLDNDLTLLSADGTPDRWTFEFRAEDPAQISGFQQYCDGHDITTHLTRLKSLAEMQAGDEYGLTAKQHEALLLAFDEGYYDNPRDTDLETLAGKLGISRPSFADRLRRGSRNLLAGTIAQHSSPDESDNE